LFSLCHVHPAWGGASFYNFPPSQLMSAKTLIDNPFTCSLVLFNLLWCGAVTAQETGADTTVPTLGTVTVVGTVADLQSLDFYAPNSSAVLSRRDLDEQGAHKLDEALHYVAGMQ